MERDADLHERINIEFSEHQVKAMDQVMLIECIEGIVLHYERLAVTKAVENIIRPVSALIGTYDKDSFGAGLDAAISEYRKRCSVELERFRTSTPAHPTGEGAE